MQFRTVQFLNITSKFGSVSHFCYRFAQLGTNCSLHRELPTSVLPIPSLAHTLNDDSVINCLRLSQPESLLLNTFSTLLGCGLFPFSADVSLAAMASIIRAVDLNSLLH